MENQVKTNEEMEKEALALPTFESGKGGVDLKEFEGQRVKIVKVMLIDSISSYDEAGVYKEGLKRAVKKLKVITEPITKINTKDGEIEIRASELFGLKQKDGKWGISDSPKASIQKLLKRQKATNIQQLVGTTVIIKAVESEDGKVFLGFVKE